ncbi:MAG: AAA family ATPase [Candidatus Magasanikbacteria bacterium]|nr:AAA family ATPase [Candidatus Magasanikbacteria bacterium]
MPTNKIVFGFTGLIASGKGTAAGYLKTKYGAAPYRFSTMLRDLCDRLYLEQSRDNMQTMSTAIRSHFGEETLSKVMAEDVKNDVSKIVCIDGIRRPGDVKYLRQIPGFVLINIFADMEKRFDRITKRGENTDDTKKTIEQFKLDHQKEAELQIADIAKEANEKIDNNGTIEELYSQLDKLVDKYAVKN